MLKSADGVKVWRKDASHFQPGRLTFERYDEFNAVVTRIQGSVSEYKFCAKTDQIVKQLRWPSGIERLSLEL